MLIVIIIIIIAKGKKNDAAILIGDLIQIYSTICERSKEQILWAQLQKQSSQHKTDEDSSFALENPKWILHLLLVRTSSSKPIKPAVLKNILNFTQNS